jgi:hypothetical protein
MLDLDSRGKKILSTLIGLTAVCSIIIGFMVALGIGYQRWSTIGVLTHDSYLYDDHITYDILKNIYDRFILRYLPLNYSPSSSAIAFSAGPSSIKLTKAIPLGRPVSRSCMIVIFLNSPYFENSSSNSHSST